VLLLDLVDLWNLLDPVGLSHLYWQHYLVYLERLLGLYNPDILVNLVIPVILSTLVLLGILVVLVLEGMVGKVGKVKDRADMVADNNHMDYMTCSTKMCIFLIIYIF
jgi:hypothetical protein